MCDQEVDICEEFERHRKSFCAFAGAGRLVEQMRYLYGNRRDMPDGSVFCLDYAMRKGDVGNYRMLAGERRLMYHWFRRCFAEEATEGDKKAFYLYLLLKSHFRREFIQANQMVGFDNFDIYQKRKDLIWEEFPPYEYEAIRMAIRAPMDKGNVRSLEVRIIPKKSPWELLRAIWKYDRSQWYAKLGICEGFPTHPSWAMKAALHTEPFFFVIHFAKEKDYSKHKSFWIMERHHGLRKKIRQNAMATAKALCYSEYLSHCIRGIDACANEIGCRPEVFATDFRFLRDFVPYRCADCYDERQAMVHLSVTYHAGEDFLDIADGLRAIDEAVRFIGMQRGDRLGHALALGVDPYAYYEGKCYQIVQPMQDRLDDLVWMLFRGNELGIRMDPCLHAELEQQAVHLLDEIYTNEKARFSLLDYYESWQLRGDSPVLYRTGKVSPMMGALHDTYHLCMANRNADEQRKRPWAVELYFRYHYDEQVRRNGNRVHVYDIQPKYIDFMRQIQDRMQSFLADCGIAIECNPSSNVMIGTFRDYACHPMFRFSSSPMGAVADGTELNISINTDDLGVFDTSLEFEYALVAHTLLCDNDGSRQLKNFEAVREYLEKIRRNGWNQVFQLYTEAPQNTVKMERSLQKMMTQEEWRYMETL